jgi:hypothetical protein
MPPGARRRPIAAPLLDLGTQHDHVEARLQRE